MLTKGQIDHLFDFCEAQGVRCYDVQVELVDHLANAIEAALADHPEWGFQKALDVVFVSFGYKKFAPLLQEKHNAAKRYCWRLFWSVFVEQLRWPWTWLGLVVFLYYYQVSALYGQQGFTKVQLISAVIVIIGISFADLYLARVQESCGKRFMLINMTRVRTMIPYGFMVIWLLHSTAGLFTVGRFVAMDRFYQLFIGVLVFAYCWMGLAYFRTTMRLRAEVKKDYPEIFKAA